MANCTSVLNTTMIRQMLAQNSPIILVFRTEIGQPAPKSSPFSPKNSSATTPRSKQTILSFRNEHDIVLGFNSTGPTGKQVHDLDAQLMLRTVEQNSIKIPLIEGILNRTFRSIL